MGGRIAHGPRYEALGLAFIGAIATILRFASLPSRGLIYWDEAKFGLEGIRLQVGLMALAGARVDWEAGKAVGTAKPMHALLIAFMYALFGVHDYAPLLLNAAASVLQIIVLYLLARTLFGPLVALVSALLLAVSEYDIVYARSALSESDGNLFLLLGVLVLVRSIHSKDWGLAGTAAAAGLVMGLAFTINYRLLVYTAVACLVVFVWAWRERRSLPWPGFVFVPGFLVFPVAWEIAGMVARSHGFDLFSNELTGRPTSYLAEVVYQMHQGKQAVIHFQPIIYLQWYLLRQGWLASLLLLVGLLQTVRLRKASWLLPAALVVLPYVVYVFAPFNVPRNLAAALPFASLLAAAGLVTIIRTLIRTPSSNLVITAACLVLAVSGALLSWRLTGVRSGFASAARYLQAHQGTQALSTTEIMAFYLRGPREQCLAQAMPVTTGSLAAAVAGGYQYMVADRHANSVTRYVAARVPAVAAYPAVGLMQIGESLISSENGNPPQTGTLPELVTVYRLTRLPLPSPTRFPIRCNPDLVI